MIYTLPQIEDPDNDTFKFNTFLQETIPFAKTINN